VILFANLLGAFARIIHGALTIYMLIVFFRVILSWVKIPALYQLAVIVYHLTEPVMRPIRRFVPPNKMGGIDLTPIIVILLIMFVDQFLTVTLSDFAHQLREQALSSSPVFN
jgi:YggT family protein